jgi:DNA-binding PadR family transcriptional regulator
LSTKLVILGLLRDQPLHGYEIKRIIEDHMGDWTSIAFGSIYFALDKLTGEGFLENIGVEQDGARPSRKIYQITQVGREEFLRLLRETWEHSERQYFAIDIGIFFMDALPQAEIKDYLRKRITALEEVVRHLDTHQAEQLNTPDVPRLAEIIFAHSVVHTRAELAWLKDTLTKVESGVYG